MDDSQISVKVEEHYEDVEVDEIEIKEEPIDWPFEGIQTEVFQIPVKEEPGNLEISNDEIYECAFCWSSFADKRLHKIHIQSHIEKRFRSILGITDEEQVNQQISIKEDVEVDEIEIKEEPIDKPLYFGEPEINIKDEPGNLEISNAETYECAFCWSSFADKRLHNIHIQSHIEERFRSILGITDEEQVNQQKIKEEEHYEDVEVDDIDIKEEPIDKPLSFGEPEINTKDEPGNLEISNGETYECAFCWSSFADKRLHNIHIQSHIEERFRSILGITDEEQVNEQKMSIKEEEHYEDIEVDDIEIKEEHR